MSKRCIINAYAGAGWYKDGQDRLRQSVPDGIDLLLFNDAELSESIYYKASCLYTIKSASIHKAIIMGYTQILWLDCSVQIISDLQPLWDIINKDGYFFMAGGWNCAQECNDMSLNYFGYSRDNAELLHSLWSCIFAFDLNNKKAKEVCDLFLQSALDGVFNGSRQHDGQSDDKRFMHHRQDQSALSLAFHKIGLKTFHPPQIYMWYVGMSEKKETNIFKVQGG